MFPLNINYDIAALFIFIPLIISHFQKKNLPIVQNKAILAFLIVAFAATVFDIVSSLIQMDSTNWTLWSVWLFNILCYIATNTLSYIYAIYCGSLVSFEDTISHKYNKIYRALIIIPFVLQMIIIFASVPSYYFFDKPLFFYVDSSKNYHRGGIFFYINYGFVIYYTIVATTVLLKRRKDLKISTLLVVFCYIFFMILGVIIQLLVPNLLVQNFGICVAIVMFSAFIQKPEEFLEGVTNLYNQTAFIKMTRHYIKQNEKFLVISIILDDTLFISNAFGINQMNSFLKKVGQFLALTFPHSEQYHLSQGKFVLLFKEYNPRDIEKYIFELRARFHEPWVSDSLELKLYSRVCVEEVPKDSHTPEGIIDIIDMVCEDIRYKRSIVYARDIDTEYTKHTALIAHLLRNALTEKRFDVYYQPIYSAQKKRLIGAEALIRMKDEEGNFVSPEEFIPISERTGDILRIGQFVFESVCKTLSSIDIHNYGIEKIDINLSVAQCMQEILADQILTICEIHRIPSSVINMEITETAAAHTPDILLKNMNRLVKEGIELSLDDYGSGYSNMSYLLNLPFKMVKIDKYIVWSAFENKKAELALKATLEMIKKIGMTVLAEGVETEEQKKWLIKMGCDYLQGFYFAKGLPKDEFLELMLSQNNKKKAKDSEEELESI